MSGANLGPANTAASFAAKPKKTVSFVSDYDDDSSDDGGVSLIDGGAFLHEEGQVKNYNGVKGHGVNGVSSISGVNGMNGNHGINGVKGLDGVKEANNMADNGVLKNTNKFTKNGEQNGVYTGIHNYGVQNGTQNGVQNGKINGYGHNEVHKQGLDPTSCVFTPTKDEHQVEATTVSDNDSTPRASVVNLAGNGAAKRPVVKLPVAATAHGANLGARRTFNNSQVNSVGSTSPSNEAVARDINQLLAASLAKKNTSFAPQETVNQGGMPVNGTNIVNGTANHGEPVFVYDNAQSDLSSDAGRHFDKSASYPSMGYLSQSDSGSSISSYLPTSLMSADPRYSDLSFGFHGIHGPTSESSSGISSGSTSIASPTRLGNVNSSYYAGSLMPFQRRIHGPINGQNGQNGGYHGMPENGNMAYIPASLSQPDLGGHNAVVPRSAAVNASSLYMTKPVYAPVPAHIRTQRSAQLNELTAGPTGRPSLDKILDPDNFPFLEAVKQNVGPNTHGVVKLKNIPFATRRAEIIAFFGRNSRILNDTEEGVHIIMERVTSKTNDAYVEFMTLHDAMTAVEKTNNQQARGRLSRLGDRPIEVELSSQAALMKDLFPLATGVFWDNAFPRLTPFNAREPWNNFKCFFSEEEMTMLVKHVEVPQRSPFSRDCPQRPFECMISTLKKMPWYMSHLITVRQRHAIYKACLALIGHLQHAVRIRKFEEVLNSGLLKRLITSAMLCPGFTVLMKDNIAFQVGMTEEQMREFNQPRMANLWLHQYTLSPKPGVPLDVLEWYIATIREESTRQINSISLNDRAHLHAMAAETNGYWGFFWHVAKFPAAGKEFDQLTLAALNILECEAVQKILIRAFADPDQTIQGQV